MITGEFTRLDYQKRLDPGERIMIVVDGNLIDLSKSVLDFWAGCFTAEYAGARDAAKFTGNGTVIGPDPGALALLLGNMPSTSVSIRVKLWANESFWADWSWYDIAELGWEEIAARTITIIGVGDGNGNGEVGAKFPWKQIAIGAGISVLVGGLIYAKRREHEL